MPFYQVVLRPVAVEFKVIVGADEGLPTRKPPKEMARHRCAGSLSDVNEEHRWQVREHMSLHQEIRHPQGNPQTATPPRATPIATAPEDTTGESLKDPGMTHIAGKRESSMDLCKSHD